MLMLFMFTANQAAAAFEHCDDPACFDYMGGVQKKSETSKDAHASHCAAGCHQAAAIPQHDACTARNADSATTFWAERPFPESAVGEGFIEPPSLA